MSDTWKRARVLRLIDDYILYAAVRAALRLSVFDLLAAGACAVDELADEIAAGGTGRPDEQLLGRLLRALEHLRLVERDARGRYLLTGEGDLLTSGRDDSLAPAALMWGEELWRDSADLLHRTITRGGPAALELHQVGSPYDWLSTQPAAGALFNEFMATRSVTVARALAGQDLTGVDAVADIGGGTGIVLATLLASHPRLRGVLFELPEVAAQARRHLDGRSAVTVAEGDMFADPLPLAGLYLLSNIVHNYPDEQAAKLLARIAALMDADAELWIVDAILDDDPHRSPTSAVALDMKMLTLFTGGRERTLTGVESLLEAAGLHVARTEPLPHGLHLVVARQRPASG
ncbi:methyltransferase [Nonomuraea spiralis]|uniref:Methyltransferase n=1 Tax=Nonomuraea spiralis TaxID=46182 RepID=A0ABV5ISB6_9ACTN|nr:methyltransferase [Nonomuraea spiralis]GGT40932.1 hydroxyneurosporene-O-methyltransferase [Nonomuraea spiralis]